MEEFDLPPRFGSVQLSQEQVNLRQRFVSEYLRDMDALKACLRLGYSISYAKDSAKNLLHDPYVQYLLAAKNDSPQSSKEQYSTNITAKNQAKAALMAIINSGYDEKAKVAALKLKFQLDREEQNASGVESSGVMIVPGIDSVADWERTAMHTQEKLMQISATD